MEKEVGGGKKKSQGRASEIKIREPEEREISLGGGYRSNRGRAVSRRGCILVSGVTEKRERKQRL